MGVYDKQWMVPIANVLKELGSEHVMIVHSEDGLDEISIAAPTYVAELKDGKIAEYKICPEELGFETSSLEELIVNSPKESLDLARLALSGGHREASAMVSMTAGAALYVAGISGSLVSGVNIAKTCIGEGNGLNKLNQLIEFTSQL
jgi:anthranilate phosphoribosyltransferase